MAPTKPQRYVLRQYRRSGHLPRHALLPTRMRDAMERQGLLTGHQLTAEGLRIGRIEARREALRLLEGAAPAGAHLDDWGNVVGGPVDDHAICLAALEVARLEPEAYELLLGMCNEDFEGDFGETVDAAVAIIERGIEEDIR